jgi:hypothetical protein
VVGLPAGLRSATTQRWSDWHAEQRAAGRRGLFAALPGGAGLERGIAVAASAVVALGVVGAIALSDSSGGGARAPIVAAPAAAAPPANAAATVSPLRPAVTYTGSAPRAGRVYASSAVAAPVTTRTLSGNVARATTAPAPTAPAAAPAAPPEPAASADPAPGVELGTTVGDEPVTAGVDTDGSGGIQVGPVVVGSPPPADEPPALVIDTGLLGALELPL